MAVVQKAQSSHQTLVLLGLLALLAAGGLWYFLRQGASTPATAELGTSPVSLGMPNPVIPTEVFADPRFEALKVYAKLPITPGPIGRTDPFAKIADQRVSESEAPTEPLPLSALGTGL